MVSPVTGSGEGGIRTLDGGIHPHNALAGRRLQPLGHFSGGPRRIAEPLLRAALLRIPPSGGGKGASATKMSLPAPPSYPRHLKPVCGYPRRVSLFTATVTLGRWHRRRSTSGITSSSRSRARRARYGYFAGGAGDERTLPTTRPRSPAEAPAPRSRRRSSSLDRHDRARHRDRPAGPRRAGRAPAHGPSRRRARHRPGRGRRRDDHVPLDAGDLHTARGRRRPPRARRAGSSSTC